VQWVASRVAAPRLVVCHLGGGCSVTAVRDGRSVDTTMGFTPLEGLVMATRSGSVDPGLLVWLLDGRVEPRELAEALERRSGLLALCGSADMAEVTRRADGGDGPAQMALAVYLHRLRAAIAAMAASLAGIDVLAFTGGVGERSAAVRAGAAAGLAFLGVSLDEARNAEVRAADADISADAAAVRTIVLGAREDLEIARSTRVALSAHAA
jgi:acetate kinase